MRGRARSAGIVIVVGAIALGACQPPAASLIAPTISAGRSYTICPQAGELPPTAVTDQAVAILRARLVDLGIETFDIAVGAACMEVTASIDDPALEEAARAAVHSTGRIGLYPVAAAEVAAVSASDAPPEGVESLVGSDEIESGEIDATAGGDDVPALVLHLDDQGSVALANWTRAHVGDAMALVVDSLVVAVPTINEPLTGGSLALTTAGDPPPIPLTAIAAMATSGPLPPEWEQPERPQG